MTTGSSRLEKKSSSSRSGRVDILPLLLVTEREVLLVVLVDLVLVPVLLPVLALRPLWEYFPYPSWPVPAAGPLRAGRDWSIDKLSTLCFDFFENSPNRLEGDDSTFVSVFSLGGSLVSVRCDLRDITGEPASRDGIRDKSLDLNESVDPAADGIVVILC